MAHTPHPFFVFARKAEYMQVIRSQSINHVVTGVTVKLAKRDFAKIFFTFAAAHLITRWPIDARKRQLQVSYQRTREEDNRNA